MDDIIMIGSVRFYPQENKIEHSSQTSRLTTMEARVLNALIAHANTTITFKELSQEAYGIDDAYSIIKSKIRHLRQKVEPDPNNPIYILTVPDVGYQLNI